jgi:hypothetical protein
MTFFANSGIAWPNLEQITAEAGAKSLDGASDLWAMLSIMESPDGASFGERPEGRAKDAARKFEEAAMLYSKIIDEVDDTALPEFTRGELELAAVENRRYDPAYIFEFRGGASARDLYREIRMRLETLASGIASLDLRGKRADAAPQVFQIMRDWESLAVLGRIVAVANRRGAYDLRRGGP